MSAITKHEWRRRCIAHLRQHGGKDLREYKVDAAQENTDWEREP